MAEGETRRCLRRTYVDGNDSEHDGGSSVNEASSLTTPGFKNQRPPQKVLVVGDKRFRIYPRYRSSKTGRQHQTSGLPSAEVSTAGTDLPRLAASSTKLSKDSSRIDGKMCQPNDNGLSETKPVQTEWKLVDESLVT